MALVAATVDSREPMSIQRLAYGVPTVVAQLSAGDFLGVCDDGAVMLVERKSPSDLCGSIADNRLLQQAKRMRAASPWSYVVVTGYLLPDAAGKTVVDGRPSGWEWGSIQGALLTCQELGVCITYATSERDYPSTLHRLASRSRSSVRIPPHREGILMSVGENLLCSLPGVGAKHAGELLAYCGSPAMALMYLTDDSPLGQVPGIGPVIRQRIRAALGLPDQSFLCVTTFGELLPATAGEERQSA